MTEMTTTIIVGLLIPLLGTMLGSAFVFFMKDEMSARLQKTLLGFASCVMVAASVWSLLIPAMEMKADSGAWSVVPAAVGFDGYRLSAAYRRTNASSAHRHRQARGHQVSLVKDRHACPCRNHTQPARRYGCRRSVCRSRKRLFAHILSRSHFRIIRHSHTEHPRRSHYLNAYARSRQQSVEIICVRIFSGVVEPIGAIAVLLLASLLMPALPYMLAFAAGAMFYVVVEELIPEASSGSTATSAL